jgi:hypothetical protein
MVDEKGNKITIEETVDEYGNKVIKKIKKGVDEHGNEFIEEETTDANGNKVIIKKKVGKDGTIEEERYDPITGERVIIKKKIGKDGREIIEETKIDKFGIINFQSYVIFSEGQNNNFFC